MEKAICCHDSPFIYRRDKICRIMLSSTESMNLQRRLYSAAALLIRAAIIFRLASISSLTSISSSPFKSGSPAAEPFPLNTASSSQSRFRSAAISRFSHPS